MNREWVSQGRTHNYFLEVYELHYAMFGDKNLAKAYVQNVFSEYAEDLAEVVETHVNGSQEENFREGMLHATQVVKNQASIRKG